MTPHQMLTVAVRLFVIWLAIVLIRDTVRFVVFDAPHADAEMITFAVGALGLSLAFSLFLWFFPRTIARTLLPLPADEPAPPANPDTWIGVGACLLGLWLAGTALSALAGNAVALFSVPDPQRVEFAVLRRSFVYLGVELLVGLLMIVGAGAIKRFVVWLRHAGTEGSA